MPGTSTRNQSFSHWSFTEVSEQHQGREKDLYRLKRTDLGPGFGFDAQSDKKKNPRNGREEPESGNYLGAGQELAGGDQESAKVRAGP